MEAYIFEAKEWAALFRDVGLIIGIPILILVGIRLYKQQIETLKAQIEGLKTQIESLKLTQYDRASEMLSSQKKVYAIERDAFETKINLLNKERDTLEERLAIAEKANFETKGLREQMSNVDFKLDTLRSALLKIEDIIEDQQTAVIHIGKALVGKFNNVNYRTVLSTEEVERFAMNQQWLRDPKLVLYKLIELRNENNLT